MIFSKIYFTKNVSSVLRNMMCLLTPLLLTLEELLTHQVKILDLIQENGSVFSKI